MKQAGPAAAEVEKYRGAEPDEALGDTGSAVVAADSLDRFRRDLIVLGLQGRIREGAVDQAAELFKLLEQLGGSVEATTDALARLVVLVRPQIDELKKQMKDEEAQKLTDVVGKLLGDQAAKDKLTPRALAFLGRSLRDLGLHEKALEVLAKVPAVDAETLKALAENKLKTQDLDPEKKDAVFAYQIAQIEQIRAYRLTKQFDKADELLLPAVGKDGKSGWAKSLEFRRERVFVLEDRATEAPKDKKGELWAAAYAGWTEVLRPYVANVSARIPAGADVARIKQDREKLYPLILDFYVEEKRCLAKANTQLLAANPMKLATQMGAFGKQIATLEKGYAKGLSTEVRERFAALLEEYPPMKAGYKEAGGVAFLDPTVELPSAPMTEEKK
jgi:tetratricopeptide (TPR) repeat protein